jgi:ER-bound oxygenase mpaB/B'/Rubber oxygenase, catalytic domain
MMSGPRRPGNPADPPAPRRRQRGGVAACAADRPNRPAGVAPTAAPCAARAGAGRWRGALTAALLYDASDPALSAWVHDSLTDSFLTAYRAYGARPCSPADADRYVREQVRVGELLGADPLPDTAAALSAWVTGHPDLAPSPAAAQAIRFLRRPPLPPAIRAAYRVLLRAAAATLPGRIGQIVGVPSRPGDLGVGRAAVTALRWSLGSSPDWRLALVRTGSSPPPGARFRQRLPGHHAAGAEPARP